MGVFVGFIRALNVGGKGLLTMPELQELCRALGLARIRTYIQSGNLVFESTLAEHELAALLERALSARLGVVTAVMLRTETELRAVLARNPFPAAAPAKLGVLFMPEPLPAALLAQITTKGAEEWRPHGRELYIHYPDGMGRTTLKLPPQLRDVGTTRNLNTVAKMLELAGK